MGIKIQSVCLHCGKEETKVNTVGKYCSNKCQREYQSKLKFSLWKSGKGTIGKGCLRTNLILENGNKCSVCNIDSWMGKQISLEIDHVDGNPYNNVYKNLRLICPNCHSQTSSYKGRNKGKGRGSGTGWLLENQSKV
jgi:Zn finger protein HypA/HybF involved in hydrogenase expression